MIAVSLRAIRLAARVAGDGVLPSSEGAGSVTAEHEPTGHPRLGAAIQKLAEWPGRAIAA
jgi:hypothetical protein